MEIYQPKKSATENRIEGQVLSLRMLTRSVAIAMRGNKDLNGIGRGAFA